jgi:outer membrane protein OmpA-like peptidoglycan-associated protein
MQLRNIMLAAAILAVPASLQAQPITGIYVGAGVGVNQLLDSNTNIVAGGKYTSSLGLGAVASIGYGFGNGLRAELEGNFRTESSKIKAGNASSNSFTTRTYGPMVNLLYDIDLKAGVTPYVGAGVGAQWGTAHGNGTDATSKAAAAAQGIVGLALPLNPNLSLTAEARVLGWLGDAKYNGGTVKNPTNVSGLVGLRYAFGAMAPMAAPAAAPAPAPMVKAEEARTYLVFFDWDKADLTARARQIIADAAGASSRLAVTRIEVAGHADKSGTAAYNQGLSMRRAQAVAGELVRLGVKKDAIAVSAFGDTKPLVPTADGVREPQNRRVEIVLK